MMLCDQDGVGKYLFNKVESTDKPTATRGKW